jgi:hypothetical protein
MWLCLTYLSSLHLPEIKLLFNRLIPTVHLSFIQDGGSGYVTDVFDVVKRGIERRFVETPEFVLCVDLWVTAPPPVLRKGRKSLIPVLL